MTRTGYKTDNAIIMAAGMATRFAPLSYEKPKALIEVKGEVLIERQIRQLIEAGVPQIIVAAGYKKELFGYLTDKYGVMLVENPDYRTRNNHSTLYHVRDYLKNSYICCSDNYYTENPFKDREDEAYYAAVYEEGQTDECCLYTDEKGYINHVQIGGSDAWVMHGHTFFTEGFSKQLIPYIEEAYHKEEDAGLYWEEIYMEHLSEMRMRRREYDVDVIQQFDCLEDLRKFDDTYLNHSGSWVMERICRELKCREKDIVGIKPVEGNDGAAGITFSVFNRRYAFDYARKYLGEC